MDVKLSEGAIEAMTKGSDITDPLLQVVNIRRIEGPPARYRLMLSDGRHSLSSFMLAGHLNFLVEENRLAILCVCKVKKTVSNVLNNGRRVVVVLDMEVVRSAEEVGERIGGTTTPYVEGQTTPPQKAAQSAPTTPAPDPAPDPAPTTTHSYTSGQFTPPQKAGHCTPTRGWPAGTPTHGWPAGTPTRSCPESTPTRSCPAAASWSPSSGRGRGRGSWKKAAPSSPGGSATKMVPIASLNPYQTKWTIRARVTNKSPIRTWSNSKGEGKLFSFQIVDESGEIRITAFNKEADKFFSLVEAGKVYYISHGTLKIANKQYNTLKNDYEMSLHTHTSIVPCDDSRDLPMVQCDFVPIADLEHRDKDAIIDVIGVCRSFEDVSRIVTKSSRETSRRNLHLMDTSGKEVTLTLWGEEAEKFDGAGQPVVAVKGARLSDFGGRSLSTVFNSTLLVNPAIPEAFRLRGWYDQEGHAMDSQSLTELRSGGSGVNTNWKTLRDVTTEHMGQGDKAEYFSCVATVLYARKESCLYQACPSEDCFKKVLDQTNGLYRCDKCDREFPNFKYRLILSPKVLCPLLSQTNLADFGGNQWVMCFQETAQALLGQSTERLGQLRDTSQTAFDEVFEKASFTTHTFRIRVKLETYNDETRVKATVMDVQSVNHRDYSRRLISNIRKMAAQTGTQGPGVRRQLWKKPLN